MAKIVQDRIAILADRRLPRGAAWRLPLTIGNAFSLTGKFVRATIRNRHGEKIVYRCQSAGEALTVAGQVITILAAPDAISEIADSEVTLADVAAYGETEYGVEILDEEDGIVLMTIQGNLQWTDPLGAPEGTTGSASAVTVSISDATATTVNVSGTGVDGASAYVYIGYASDDEGTDYSASPGAGLDHIAFLATNTEIETPTAEDFAGLWVAVAGSSSSETAASIKTKYESNADTNAFTDAEKTKLSGIEANATADQTGAEIKAAYEAQSNTNAFTDAEQSKLSGIEANAKDDQTGAEIKALYEAEANTNAFTDAEKTKLSGIESSATADQTGAEIKALYEAEANTNAFTDAEKAKLSGLESSHFKGLYSSTGALATAHATGEPGDYAHVDLGTGNAVALYVWDEDDAEWVAAGGESTAETAASIKTKYESNADTNAFTDAEKTKLSGVESNAKDDQTGAEIKALYEAEADTNAFTDAEKAKIANVPSDTNSALAAKETPSGAQSKVDTHASNTSNPHSVTKTQVGLGNVDNTSDANKPVSTATQTALDAKASATAPYWVEVVLTAAGAAIASGTKVAMMTHMQAGTITGFKIVCDPANEPSAAAVQVDMNAIDLSTGAATSRLSSVASIATGVNVSTGGAISGTQTVAVGDQSSFDIDQGFDGKELRALVQITPS